MLSHVQLFVTPWTCIQQASLFIKLSRQGYWSRLPFPLLEDLPESGIKPEVSKLAGGFFTTETPGKSYQMIHTQYLWTILQILTLPPGRRSYVMLLISMQTPDHWNLKVDWCWWYWLLLTSPSIRQKNVHKLIIPSFTIKLVIIFPKLGCLLLRAWPHSLLLCLAKQ